MSQQQSTATRYATDLVKRLSEIKKSDMTPTEKNTEYFKIYNEAMKIYPKVYTQKGQIREGYVSSNAEIYLSRLLIALNKTLFPNLEQIANRPKTFRHRGLQKVRGLTSGLTSYLSFRKPKQQQQPQQFQQMRPLTQQQLRQMRGQQQNRK